MNNQDTVQELLSPLKRLKTTTTAESMETKTEEKTKENPKSTYIVKVYDSTDEILLNTIVEFVGIYYDHPVIKADDMQTAYVQQNNFEIHFLMFLFSSRNQIDEDKLPHVKTLHCIQYKKLSHINPLLHHQPTINLDQSKTNSILFCLSFIFVFSSSYKCSSNTSLNFRINLSQ